MDNAITMYIVIGLLAIFFIVLLIFCAKTWRVLHMISAFLVFVAAGFFIWFAAASLKTNSTWKEKVESLTAEIEAKEKEELLLLEGAATERPEHPKSPFERVEYVEDSVRDVRGALQHVLMERGRVWNKCAPAFADQVVTLTIPEQDPLGAPAEDAGDGADEPPADEDEPPADDDADAEPAEPAAGHGIKVNTVVYAFSEAASPMRDVDLSGQTFPAVYLGAFDVLGGDPKDPADPAHRYDPTTTTIQLRPTRPLTALQSANLNTSTWTIYDKMPTDTRTAFAGISEPNLRLLLPRDRLTMALNSPRFESAVS